MQTHDYIVFEKMEASERGWLFEAHIELLPGTGHEAAFKKAFAAPLNLPILSNHDPSCQIGHLHSDGSGKFNGVVNATLCHRMALGIGFKRLKDRTDENGPRVIEEVQLWEVSLFPNERGPYVGF